MAFADFLLQGSPGPSGVTAGSSATSLPPFMEDYTYGLLSSAAQVGSQPYQPYGGSRIAGPNSFNMSGRANLFNHAYAGTGDISRGTTMTGNAAGMSGYGTATPYLTQAAGIDARGSAQPFLDAAGQTFPGAMQSYLSPYITGVVDEIGRLGQRNFNENLLPGVNDIFTRSGQFGSTRHQEEANRVARDAAMDITGQQTGALERAFGQAGGMFQADASRFGGLASTAAGIDENQARRLAEIGSTSGNLLNADAARMLAAGNQLGSLGQQTQDMYIKGGLAQNAAGDLIRGDDQAHFDLAYQDFLRQQQFPKEQLGFLSNVIRGVPYSSSSYSTTSAPSGYNPSLLSSLAGLGTGLYGLSQLKARGGPVRRFARGGEVVRYPGFMRVEPSTTGYLFMKRAA